MSSFTVSICSATSDHLPGNCREQPSDMRKVKIWVAFVIYCCKEIKTEYLLKCESDRDVGGIGSVKGLYIIYNVNFIFMDRLT